MGEVQVKAPFAGYAVLTVHEGAQVRVGDPLGVVEAVKMEAAVRSPAAGRVRVALVHQEAHVSGGDHLLTIASD